MTREEIRARIEEIGIIPAIRVSSAEDALFAAEAVSESAIPIVEVTMTVPGAVQVIRELTSHHPGVLVGAGTLFRVETARRCLEAGAAFLTTPGLDFEIVNFAQGRGVVVFPGALTPTEVGNAWKAGVDFVKTSTGFGPGGATVADVRLMREAVGPSIGVKASGGIRTLEDLQAMVAAGATRIGTSAGVRLVAAAR